MRWLALLVGAVLLAACGNNGDDGEGATGPPYEVSSQVVSDTRTQQMRVWAPDVQGDWPVVFALPGIGGRTSDFDLLGPALASHGFVVVATDYRTFDMGGTEQQMAADIECGYRSAMGVAPEYGGDLGRPVTGIGYSFGARWMLAGTLREPAGGGDTVRSCGRRVPLPEVVVGVNGCYYQPGHPPTGVAMADLDRREAQVALVAAEKDRTCPARHSERAAAQLREAGLAVQLTVLPGANHATPVFHDLDHGTWVVARDHTDGDATVAAILAAIDRAS